MVAFLIGLKKKYGVEARELIETLLEY